MFGQSMLKSSRLFLYLGFGLIFLALVTFPVTVRVPVGAGFNRYSIGWLFAPVIGAWGLASIAFGITESSLPKKEAFVFLLPVFAFLFIGLGFGSWMVMNYGTLWFWRVYFGFLLIPFLTSLTVGFFYFTKKEKLTTTLKNTRTRTYVLVALATVPLLYTVVFLFLFSIFT